MEVFKRSHPGHCDRHQAASCHQQSIFQQRCTHQDSYRHSNIHSDLTTTLWKQYGCGRTREQAGEEPQQKGDIGRIHSPAEREEQTHHPQDPLSMSVSSMGKLTLLCCNHCEVGLLLLEAKRNPDGAPPSTRSLGQFPGEGPPVKPFPIDTASRVAQITPSEQRRWVFSVIRKVSAGQCPCGKVPYSGVTASYS